MSLKPMDFSVAGLPFSLHCLFIFAFLLTKTVKQSIKSLLCTIHFFSVCAVASSERTPALRDFFLWNLRKCDVVVLLETQFTEIGE